MKEFNDSPIIPGIFISGSSSSGSTFLEDLLSSSTDFSGLGELKTLDLENEENIKKRKSLINKLNIKEFNFIKGKWSLSLIRELSNQNIKFIESSKSPQRVKFFLNEVDSNFLVIFIWKKCSLYVDKLINRKKGRFGSNRFTTFLKLI